MEGEGPTSKGREGIGGERGGREGEGEWKGERSASRGGLTPLTTHLMLFSEHPPIYASSCMTISGGRTEQHVIGFRDLAAVD